MKKRIISFALVVLMLVTLVPLSAFALGTVTITEQPKDVTAFAGDDATFSVTAKLENSKTGSLKYIWFDAEDVDLGSLSFANKVSTLLKKALGTNSTLTLNDVTANQDGMKLCCAVYSITDIAIVLSNEVTLHVSVAEPCDVHTLTYHEAKDETCCADGCLGYYSCSVCHRLYMDAGCNIEVTMAQIAIPTDPTAHDMEHHDRVEPTCKKDGSIEYWQCNYCGNRYSNPEGTGNKLKLSDIEIDNKDAKHQLTLVPAKESTCCEKGNKEYYVCDVCGDFYNAAGTMKYSHNDVELPLLAHTPAYAHDSNTHWQYCTMCESIIDHTTELHNSDVREATCVLKAVCECGYEYGEVNAYNHVNTELRNFKESTVAGPGYTGDLYCIDCGELIKKGYETDMLCAHHLTHYDAKDAGCEKCEDGGIGNIEYWYCDKCGCYYTDAEAQNEISADNVIIPANTHYVKIPFSSSMIANIAVQQYAYDASGHWKECKYCHYIFETSFATHTIINSIVPTCCSGKTCLACGWDNGERDSENHVGGTELVGACEPADGKPGYTGDEICKGCEAVLKKGWEYYPACGDCANHLEHIAAVPSTCTMDGTLEHWKCSLCGNIYMDARATIPGDNDSINDKCTGHELHPGSDIMALDVISLATKLGWSYNDLLELVKSGNYSDLKNLRIEDFLDQITIKDIDHCHDDEYHWLGCQKCGKSLADIREDLEKQGLFINPKWYEISEKQAHTGGVADCSHKAICDVCGEEYGELGDHRYNKVAVEPTCTEPGYIKYVCTGCGKEDTARAETFPALGHCYVKGVCSRCPARNSNPFWDVKSSDIYYTAVMWAYTYDPQITAGKTDNYFKPADDCTRGQVVTFLWRAAGRPEPASQTNPFKDVFNYGNCAPFYKAILWAAENGITTGYPDGSFQPNKTVSRAEFVTFLWRYYGEPAPSTNLNPFVDVKDTSVFRNAILWAYGQGITTGYDATHFQPNKTCNRWQVVMFMYRAIGEGKAY